MSDAPLDSSASLAPTKRGKLSPIAAVALAIHISLTGEARALSLPTPADAALSSEYQASETLFLKDLSAAIHIVPGEKTTLKIEAPENYRERLLIFQRLLIFPIRKVEEREIRERSVSGTVGHTLRGSGSPNGAQASPSMTIHVPRGTAIVVEDCPKVKIEGVGGTVSARLREDDELTVLTPKVMNPQNNLWIAAKDGARVQADGAFADVTITGTELAMISVSGKKRSVDVDATGACAVNVDGPVDTFFRVRKSPEADVTRDGFSVSQVRGPQSTVALEQGERSGRSAKG